MIVLTLKRFNNRNQPFYQREKFSMLFCVIENNILLNIVYIIFLSLILSVTVLRRIQDESKKKITVEK